MLGLMQDRPLLVSSLLQYALTYHGEREVVARSVEGSVIRSNWRTIGARAAKLANALANAGVQRGERVATLAWNTDRHLELFYAVSGMGAVLHTVNPRLFDDQIIYILNHGGARHVFVDETFQPLVDRIRDRLTRDLHFYALSGARSGWTGYENFIEHESECVSWPDFDEKSASSLCYTSGTTGDPKGVLYSHRSTILHALAAANKAAFDVSADDVMMAIAPMYHANAWATPYVAALVGAKFVMPGPRHDPENLVSLIRNEGVTFAVGVPTIWTSTLQYLRDEGGGLGRLRRTMIGGSALAPAMVEALRAHGVEARQAWGMTETSPLGVASTHTPTSAALPDDVRARQEAKQGRALYGVELKITGDDGKSLVHDGRVAGDLWVRGPWIARAYFQRDQEPLLDQEGWFPTGDVATIDALGFMQITDRSKDVIKSGGEWISSIELENAAVSHPDVALAAVIGIPDPKWDERPLLIVQCAPGKSIDLAAMRAHLEPRVAKWWLPEALEIVEEMPLTATGKIRKTELRKRFVANAASVA